MGRRAVRRGHGDREGTPRISRGEGQYTAEFLRDVLKNYPMQVGALPALDAGKAPTCQSQGVLPSLPTALASSTWLQVVPDRLMERVPQLVPRFCTRNAVAVVAMMVISWPPMYCRRRRV